MQPTTIAVAAAVALIALACAGSPSNDAIPASDVQPSQEIRPDLRPLIEGPVSADGLRAILATADLGVGEQRVGFVLTTQEGLVRVPAVRVTSRYIGGGYPEGEDRETTLGVFRPWPLGSRGSYTTRLTFDRPGRWELGIAVLSAEDPGGSAKLSFDVADTPSATAVGAPAVMSDSKTIGDVKRISQLTTGSLHDPELYQRTIADAVASELPTVVVMASPAFCTNAVCGPQVEVLQQLKDRYRGQANFIHVDFYDNPEEIQGDLDRARLSPTVVEWGLPSIEWSFVIDRDGVVSARFEAFATIEELEEALLQVL